MSKLTIKYFVLKPMGTDIYAKASRFAIKKYADVIRSYDIELSNDLLIWLSEASKQMTSKRLTEGE